MRDTTSGGHPPELISNNTPSLLYYDTQIIFGASHNSLSCLPVSMIDQTISAAVEVATVAGLWRLTPLLSWLWGGDLTLPLTLLTVSVVTRL